METAFNEDYLVSSEDYSGTMDLQVLPWLKARENVVKVPGEGGRPLWCASYAAEDPVATVVIVHGFTENAFKYSELIFSLLHRHFSVVAYDQRGHGRSWRADGIADLSVTHVDRFENYVADLKAVCDHFLPSMPKPALVFAHSMGGAVTSLFLEKYPDVFAAAALCAPMIAPNTKGVPVFVTKALCGWNNAIGNDKKHPFIMKPWSGPEDFETSCATDPRRFAWYDAIKTKTELFHNSIPSYRWTSESLAVTKKILAPGEPEKIACPVLLFTAEHDFSVLPGPQEAFISRVRGGRRIFVKDARHEIFRSVNAVFFPWWHQILAFFLEKGGVKA
ncbi:MAG: alpha/beta hydrolase [Clostridia bacterium]|jgi:lysophospholipase